LSERVAYSSWSKLTEPHLGRDLQQMPQLLDPNIRRAQVGQLLLPVVCFDQVLQHIKLELDQPVAK